MNFFRPECGLKHKLYVSRVDPEKLRESGSSLQQQIAELKEKLALAESIAIECDSDILSIADYQEINR
ncbi:hypothetical protein H6F89_03275 [Cyanobacteria bacterium FACHB-63]|nr:hypothetical protein [Cyanobacteria bacterium FACHB-63]